MAFSPHKFVQVAWKLMTVATSHMFEFDFNLVTIAFNVLSVDSCCGIKKWRLWFTIQCCRHKPRNLWMPLYAHHSSVWTIDPLAICLLIMHGSVVAVLFSTSCMYPREGVQKVSAMPNTQTWWVVGRPLWFYVWIIKTMIIFYCS